MSLELQTYRNERIKIADLAQRSQLALAIADLTFVECLIDGPAVLYPVNCMFVGFRADSPLYSVFLEVPEQWRPTAGVITATGCTFDDCTFSNVGIAGSATTLIGMRHALDIT